MRCRDPGDLTERAVLLYEVDTGRRLWRLGNFNDYSDVTTADLSPDGTRVAVASSDRREVTVWPVGGFDPLRTLSPRDRVQHLSFSPDGERLLVSLSTEVEAFNVQTGRRLASFRHSGNAFLNAAFGPDGRRVVTWEDDGLVRVWETDTGQQMAAVEAGTDLRLARLGRGGRRLVTCRTDGVQRVWEAGYDPGSFIRVTHDAPVRTITFTPDGRRAVVQAIESVATWDLQGPQLDRTLRPTDSSEFLAVSPDGRRAASRSPGRVHLWDLTDGGRLAAVPFNGLAEWLGFSPSGRLLAATAFGGEVTLLMADTGRQATRVRHPRVGGNRSARAVVSPDEGWMASWEVSPPGAPQKVLMPGEQSPGVGDPAAGVAVWETATGREVARLSHPGFVTRVAFGPGRDHLTSVGNDDVIRVWELPTGRLAWSAAGGEVRVMYGINGGVPSLSPDGGRLVRGSRHLQVWDVGARRPASPPFEVAAGIDLFAVFGERGSAVATISSQVPARVWDADFGRPNPPPSTRPEAPPGGGVSVGCTCGLDSMGSP